MVGKQDAGEVVYKVYNSVKNDPRTNALGAAEDIAKTIGSRDLLLRMVADSGLKTHTCRSGLKVMRP